MELRVNEIYEYDLADGEPTLTGNPPGKQRFKVVSIGPQGVQIAYLASEIIPESPSSFWVVSRPLGPEVIDYTFTHRNGRLIGLDAPVTKDAGPVVEKVSSEALDLDFLNVPRLTSEVAVIMQKPVAAANSRLSALERRGIVTKTQTPEGISWKRA